MQQLRGVWGSEDGRVWTLMPLRWGLEWAERNIWDDVKSSHDAGTATEGLGRGYLAVASAVFDGTLSVESTTAVT